MYYNKCCIENCGTKRKDVKMHPFPASEIRLKKWLLSINSDYLRSLSVQELQKLCVCQKHFEKRFFSEKYGLKVGSYPSLFSADEIASGMPTKVKEDVYQNHDHNYSRKRKHDDHTYARPPDTTLAEKLANELELENLENRFSNVEDMPAQHAETDSEDDEPLTEFKIEVDEHEVLWKTPILEQVITDEQKQNEIDTKVIWTTENCTFETVTTFNEPLTDTHHGVNHFSLDTNTTESKREKLNEVTVSDFENRHQRPCLKLKPYKCDVCHRCFSQKIHFTNHILTHTGEKPYKCDICPRSFSQNGNLKTHIRTHTGEKPYKCEICQRSFTSMGILTDHIRTHTGEKPYKCDVCQRCFRRKSQVTKHTRTHTGEKPYKCDICPRSFCQSGTLKIHIRTHTGEKPYKCDACQRWFSKKSQFTNHIRTHTSEKPYKCDVCQRCFSHKSHFTVHIRTHTGEKPYKCDICHRSFCHKNSLKIHIRTHTGEKPYKCDVCQRCFSQKSHFILHIRTHTGVKPYECEVCQRCFNYKSVLARHICK